MADVSRAVLVVFPFCLDHVGHGNIQRILGIARYFAASGFDVDLAYQGSAHVGQVKAQYAGFRRVFRVGPDARSTDEDACARRLVAFYAGHELPTAHMRPSAPLTALVRALLEAEPYDAAIGTYAFTAPVFAGLRRRILTVCDVQDVLHEHADACQRATGQVSSFSLPAATEAFLWRQWDLLVAITPEDKDRIRRDALPHQPIVSARHAATTFAPAASPGPDDVALYAGSDNQSNVQAVRWLLEQVWPAVIAARPSARLRMAGLICSALPESLRQCPGVELLGFQPDISREVDGCGVLVAPYLYGSGLKIKVVEGACAGKAMVTTRSGAAGTGLETGRALEVHDDPSAFARALVGLLADPVHRAAMAREALAEARALFSPEACYEPIAVALRLHAAHAAVGSGHGMSPVLLDRVRIVVDHARPRRVVLWGNGAHTRALIVALGPLEISVHLIVDGRATAAAVSPEGIPVVPASQFPLVPGDLVVLSSETFEPEMWRDLASYRDAGGHVLGLCDSRYISRDLLDRLSHQARMQVGATGATRRSDGTPTVVLWDSGATTPRWWRMCALRDLAAVAPRFGAQAMVVMPRVLVQDASHGVDMPVHTTVAAVLELDGRFMEDQSPDGGTHGLARVTDLMARTTAHALDVAVLGPNDVLVMVRPSLSECLGLAQALRSLGKGRCPSVVLYGRGAAERTLELPDADIRAYWRLAVSELADAADGRFGVVGIDCAGAAELRARLDRTVHPIGHPTRPVDARAWRPAPRIVCLGHVGVPRVQPLLTAVVEAFSRNPAAPSRRASIAWRSNQNDGRPGTDNEWAVGVALALDVELLDPLAPAAMQSAIMTADAVAVLADSAEGWLEAVRAYAASAGIPVVESCDADALVSQLAEALSGWTPGPSPDAPSVERSGNQTAEAVLARLLDVAAGRAPVAAEPDPALLLTTHASSYNELVTEICL